MLKVEVNKKSENPFFGMRHTIALFQELGKGQFSVMRLDQSWEEVKNSAEGRQMFFSLLFSIGDITARQHNIFQKNKVDSGGNALRSTFQDIMIWIRVKHNAQFWKFVESHLFNEYTTFDNLVSARVRTKKGTNKIEHVFNFIGDSPKEVTRMAKFIARVMVGNNPFNKHLVAKFLTRPRLSKRSGHKIMLPQTKANMKLKESLIKQISDFIKLPYTDKGSYISFDGYYNWRKEYNGDLESVLFSTGKIKEFDKQQFISWLDKLPSGARFRVRTRMLTKDNQPKMTEGNLPQPVWGDMYKWFLEWENYKQDKQAEARVLEEKVRQGTASQDEEAKLVKVKKEAKVTTGAVNFTEIFSEIVRGTVDTIKVQPFLDKVKLDYNTLVFVDDSGSMRNGYGTYGFSAFDMAAFMATILLMKNPDDTGRSLMGMFSATTRMFSTMNLQVSKANNLMRGTVQPISEPLIKPEQHFLQNLQRMRQFMQANQTGNGTYLDTIPDYINQWVGGDNVKLEALQNFPVWTFVTDGNFNSLPSPEATINSFMMKAERFFGFKPFVIAIDVAAGASAAVNRFEGIENFMYIPPNPAQIEQFLTNFKDIEIMDIYTPLLSIFRSNRYAPVREKTL